MSSRFRDGRVIVIIEMQVVDRRLQVIGPSFIVKYHLVYFLAAGVKRRSRLNAQLLYESNHEHVLVHSIAWIVYITCISHKSLSLKQEIGIGYTGTSGTVLYHVSQSRFQTSWWGAVVSDSLRYSDGSVS